MGRLRVGAVLAALLLLPGCQVGAPSVELAADQTLTFPIDRDVSTLDPVFLDIVGDPIAWNLFGGLYRFDTNLQVVPDIAQELPAVSADGLTYTFHLRKNARFSNGDPVRAQDFIYSWNRLVIRKGETSFIFAPVIGYDEVVSKKATAMSGLAAPDDRTLVARLVRPTGVWLTQLALPPAWVVDSKVIQARGEDAWWTTPEGLVGTGPFKMIGRVPKQSVDFVPVADWWGGSTGALKKVHAEVMPDVARQVTKYRQGGYDVIGYGEVVRFEEQLAPLVDFHNDQAHSQELLLQPFLRTRSLKFNFEKGPFAGRDAGRLGRLAFSQAIDRNRLATTVCNQRTTCVPATGGIITKGLKGYLGDNGDPNAKFDPNAALAAYQKWDPDRTKIKGLKLRANAAFAAVAENLRSQWKDNLGISIEVETLEGASFGRNAQKRAYDLFIQGWLADYDHPRNWFANHFTTNAPVNWSGYSNPRLEALLSEADQKPLTESLPRYLDAGKILVEDVAYAALDYQLRGYLVKPYVQGAGGNALYEYPWTGIKILKH